MGGCHTSLTAITVSVDYSDYLRHTLPHLVAAVDRTIVITTHSDTKTKNVAQHCGAEIIETESFYQPGPYWSQASFNKGAAINRALDLVDTGWTLHVDADILVPQKIQTNDLDRAVLWHAMRCIVRGRGALRMWLAGIRDFPLVCSSIIYRGRPCAIGAFQMWDSAIFPYRYSEEYPTASQSDILFSLQFPRVEVLDMRIGHLEADNCTRHGFNWSGRTSAIFDDVE